MSRRPDVAAAPSTGVVVTGALAVAVVVLFVTSVVFGSESRAEPGDRVAVVKGGNDVLSGYVVVVGRCEDERVRAIEVLDQRGAPLWRVEAAKGSFERRFPIGETSFGFTEVVPLRGLPDGPVEVTVAVGDDVDAEVVDLREVDHDASVGAPCGGSSVGAVGWVFALGALLVVVSYGAMLLRFRRGGRGGDG